MTENKDMAMTDMVAKKAEYGIGDKLSFIFSSIWAFFWPIIAAAMTSVGKAAVASIQAAVIEAEQNFGPGAGSQKFNYAFEKVKIDMEGQGFLIGVDVGVKLINALINIAAQKVS
jgi:superoxide dismutase